MGDKKIYEELKALHVKSDALKKAKARGTKTPKAKDASKRKVTAGDNEKEMPFDLSAQVKELMDTLDKELKDTNPVILLGVFALGVFIGRLLPR